jgi:hypothetical protein
MLLTADMPIHPPLLQLNQDQVLLMAIIAPLSSSLINERLRHFRYPKIKADEPSLMLHPHARARAEPLQNLGRVVNRGPAEGTGVKAPALICLVPRARIRG